MSLKRNCNVCGLLGMSWLLPDQICAAWVDMIGISSVLADDGQDPKMQELVSNKEH
jgi:hypothetical protein